MDDMTKDQTAHAAGETPEAVPLKTLIVVQASTVQPEPISWLWQERIALGKLTLIAGDPGLGKSMLSIAMTAHITRGKLWPVDQSRAPLGDVVILSAEDDLADTIRPRLDAAGADPDRVHVVQSIRAIDQDTNEEYNRYFSLKVDIDALDNFLSNHAEVNTVFIDPISAYLGGTDSHKNADVRGLLMPISELAARYKVAVIAITHLNKSGNGSAMYRAMGSLAFVAAARAAFVVTRDKDEPQRRLFLPIKNNIGNDTTGLAYSIEEASNGAPCLAWEPNPVTVQADQALSQDTEHETTAIDDAKEWLELELEAGPVLTSELQKRAKSAGHSWATVRRAKSDLGVEATKSGAFSEGRWSWQLPKMLKNTEDAHSNNVNTLGDDEHLGSKAEPGTMVTCRDCQYFEPDNINPPGGLGSCKQGMPGLAWPVRELCCELFHDNRES